MPHLGYLDRFMKKELAVGIALSLIAIAMAIYFAGRYSGINRSIRDGGFNPASRSSSGQTEQSTSGPVNLSVQEVAKHFSASDCWLIISGKVYNVTSFLGQHPGGAQAIIDYCGQDATVAFDTQGGRGSHSPSARLLLGSFLLGNLNDSVSPNQVQKVQTAVPSGFVGGGEREDD